MFHAWSVCMYKTEAHTEEQLHADLDFTALRCGLYWQGINIMVSFLWFFCVTDVSISVFSLLWFCLLLLLIVVVLLCKPFINQAVFLPFLSLPGLSCKYPLLQGSFLLGVLPHLSFHTILFTSVWSLLNSLSFSPCFKDALIIPPV